MYLKSIRCLVPGTGLLVTQPYESPDFQIENRLGGEAWVYAVTANPPLPYNHVNALPTVRPTSREEIFFGRQRCASPASLTVIMTNCSTSLGKPFMIAIADFQAPDSMIWSR
jgi:hypothetical protein